MSHPKNGPEDLANRLINEGLLSGGGEVDPGFYALRVGADVARIREALEGLARKGVLRAETRWQCPDCEAEQLAIEVACANCDTLRPANVRETRVFLRKAKPAQRDPAAVFLIHGMNTLGDWQQSLAWKIQLMYGYSLPVFVFKFGRDLTAPLTRLMQGRRTLQLARAVREAQANLQSAGRNNRCDVVAHSFGTLLLARLLANSDCDDLEFGRIVLSGSIVPQDFPWSEFVASGRIEAILNHRAGRDTWVRLAPWFFPGVGASGFYGFDDPRGPQDHVSSAFRHSDFFKALNFDTVIRHTWAAFLTNQKSYPVPALRGPQSLLSKQIGNGKYRLGRMLLVVTGVAGVLFALKLLALLGEGSRIVLNLLGFRS